MKKFLLIGFAALSFTNMAKAQATQLSNNEGLELLGLLNSNQGIFYSQKTNKLWISDGTAAGTRTYTNKVLVTASGLNAIINGRILFTGNDGATGTELWSTDGTDAGTVLVKDINPGAAASAPADRFIFHNNEIYFSAATAATGRELWKTNGTEAGTKLVKDIVSGAAGSNEPSSFEIANAGNHVFFSCNTPGEGEELWRTDGTEAGTLLLRDIRTGQASSSPVILGVYNNKIIFSADDLLHGREPWISDGTIAGTTQLKDIAAGPLSSSASNFIVFNSNLLFVAFDPVNGQELWQSNGTEAGTQLLKDIEPGITGSSPALFNAIKVNNKLFFSARHSDSGVELWETDGTTNGTKLFVDVFPGEMDAFPMLLPSYTSGYAVNSQLFQGNKFFFAAFTSTHGFELYISDGTVGGTRLVKDLDGDTDNGFTGGYYISNNAIYFNGFDGTHEGALFKSDGTAAGTVLVSAVNPNGDSEVMPFVILNNALLFYGNEGNNPDDVLNDLYRLDGTEVVLPVNILSFTGRNDAGKNLLSWQVTNAVNFDHFNVERSSDGLQFSSIGNVSWNAATATYSFTDNQLSTQPATYYYRLKLTDRDGSFHYSATVALNTTGHARNDLKTWRSGTGEIAVRYNLASPTGSVRITDMGGRVLLSKQLTSISGHLNLSLPVATQVLNISLQQGDEIITKRIW